MTDRPQMTIKDQICDEILFIMETYHRQENEHGYIGTPGGLEHMGDVWKLFLEWESRLRAPSETERLRAILQDVVDDMLFTVGPSKGTMAKIEQALKNG